MTTQVSTLLGIAVATCVLAGIMWRLMRPVLRMTVQLHGEDGDERRGIAARPGILERQTATERRAEAMAAEMATMKQLLERRNAEMQRKLDEALAQLRKNGGNSVKDVVDKTYAAVTAALPAPDPASAPY